MNSKAMFAAGAVLALAGTFAIGAAAGGAAEAASYKTTAITYLAPIGNGFNGCGFQVPGTGDAKETVRRIKMYEGDEDIVLCQAVIRVPR